MNMDFEAWRCSKHKGFCPEEGCTLKDGCARDRGWIPDNPMQRTEEDEKRATEKK